ncbi:MAG: VTT domain-containing protein [bacterium]|nr:VTT domain-containing protein [bacterium]
MELIAVITAAGLAGITFVIFAESGLLIGFFLPGDSLLFTAGVLASSGVLNIWWLIVLATVAAIAGDSVGYAFGKHVGPKVFRRPNSLLFHPEHVERSRRFFAKHGPKAIMLARFMPIIRTFTPVLAGVGRMHYPTFLAYNVIGALIWATGIPLAGYTLGRVIPDIDRYLIPIVIAIVLVSVAPGMWNLLHDPVMRMRLIAVARAVWQRVRGLQGV